jgi:hypothetical protein
MSSVRSLLTTLVLLTSCVFAQDSRSVVPLPDDPLEVATGAAQPIGDPAKRTLVLGLLEGVRQNNGMHVAGGAPFAMKLSYDSIGANRYIGHGEADETWLNGRTWHWSAQLAGYSIHRIFYQGAAFDEKPKGPIPLRIKMVRDAAFWPVSGQFAAANLRVASAKWEGVEVVCVLQSRGADASTFNDATGRHWEEREYCIDPKTGFLRTYSEAPGIYTVYNYDEVMNFHGRTLARTIYVVQAGEIVLHIHLDSIADPQPTPNEFIPTQEMLARGPGLMMYPPEHMWVEDGQLPGQSGVQPVIVHASLDERGKVLEAELIDRNSPLGKDALAFVQTRTFPSGYKGDRQREAFIEVKFTPPK